MSSLAQRRNIMPLIEEAVAAGARQTRACEVIGLSVRTLQRWSRHPEQGDRRPDRVQQPHNGLSELECQRIVSVLNSAEYGHLPPSQIVPRLADQGDLSCQRIDALQAVAPPRSAWPQKRRARTPAIGQAPHA